VSGVKVAGHEADLSVAQRSRKYGSMQRLPPHTFSWLNDKLLKQRDVFTIIQLSYIAGLDFYSGGHWL
jgi:hypothetical protein